MSVVAILVVAGCGGGDTVDLPAPASLAARCGSPDLGRAAQFWFRASDDTPLMGAIRGSGDVGVVIAHGYGGDLCNELTLADLLAEAGIQVLVYDTRGFGKSQRPDDHARLYDYTSDVRGAVDELRERGAKRVFLVGNSYGGTIVLAAAPKLDPAPAGVVALGAPATLRDTFGTAYDLDGLGRAHALRSPLLYLVGSDDGHVDLDQARSLVRRAPSRDKRLIVYPGDYHAEALLFEAPYQLSARRMLLHFLETRS